MPALRPTPAHTLTSALQPLFRPWRGWHALLRHRAATSGVVHFALTLTILSLVLLHVMRYVLALLLALFAVGLTLLIGIGYLGFILFAVLFSSLVGGAFAVRDTPTGRCWLDDRHPGPRP